PSSLPNADEIVDSDILLRDGEREYLSTDVIERIVPIINFTEPANNRYSIGRIPRRASWGPVADGTGMERFLCDNGRPITVWMVGIVTSVWLAPTEGSRVSIGVRLLCRRDMEAARFIQYRMSHPHADGSNAGLTTFASRYLAPRGEESVTTFADVFDACDLLAAWSVMRKIDCERIRKTDLVVVEAYIKRFRHRDSGNRFTWVNWGVSFDLLRIALLYPGPGPIDPTPEDSHVNL
ncbi:hypothetical protein FKP32DRAFT_1580370, partial [Trametes sanguinea]